MQNAIFLYQMQVVHHLLTPTTLGYHTATLWCHYCEAAARYSHRDISLSDLAISRRPRKRADHGHTFEYFDSMFHGGYQLLYLLVSQ